MQARVQSTVSDSLRQLIQQMARAKTPEEARAIAEQRVVEMCLKELKTISDTTIPLTSIGEWIKDLDAESEPATRILYGNTPFCSVLKKVQDRFQREIRHSGSDARTVLFVISDGVPTDGDPRPLARALKEMGVVICCCFVTDNDLLSPRDLYAERQPGWSEGAHLMFDIASATEEGSSVGAYFREVGWHVPPAAKMFAQVNHSDVLDRFVTAVFRTAKAGERAGPAVTGNSGR